VKKIKNNNENIMVVSKPLKTKRLEVARQDFSVLGSIYPTRDA
jgi:hypothetical protein